MLLVRTDFLFKIVWLSYESLKLNKNLSSIENNFFIKSYYSIDVIIILFIRSDADKSKSSGNLIIEKDIFSLEFSKLIIWSIMGSTTVTAPVYTMVIGWPGRPGATSIFQYRL